MVAVSLSLKRLLDLDIDNISFVNISSLAAMQPFETWGIYCSVKAARNMFMQVISSEAEILTQQSSNKKAVVRTLNYAPGPLDTDMQTTIRDNAPHEPQREYFKGLKDQDTLVKPIDSAKKLMAILELDEFKNGSHIDYYD